jgi:hypothetical protein
VVKLASNKPLKGHLTNQERTTDDSQTVEGVLKQIVKDRIDSDGWYVEVGKDNDKYVYHCSYPQWATGGTIPESTETNTLYVPVGKVRVEITIDKKNKIYIIQRLIDNSKASIVNYNNELHISVNSNTKTNQDVNANVKLTNDTINLNADSVVVTDNNNNEFDLIESHTIQIGQIQVLQEENKKLQERISTIEEQLNTENKSDELENQSEKDE